MKFSYAATVLIALSSSSSNSPSTSVVVESFTPNNLIHRPSFTGKTAGGVLNYASIATHHNPTRNNIGRRKIKAWHKLELQPWAGLKMSAAVDEPAASSTLNGGWSKRTEVNGQVDEQQLAAAMTAKAMDAQSRANQSLSGTRESAEAYLKHYEGESGASAVYTKLQEYGVPVVNGYSGGAVLPLLDQFHEDHPRHKEPGAPKPIRWITNSNESSAGHVAEGFAKSSFAPDGKLAPGVVVATSGPGVTNLVTPLQDAICDGVPMVVLCGQAATNAPEAAFQSVPAVEVTSPCTKWSYQITSAAEVPFVMDYAFYVAQHGRPGPVFVDLPKDLLNQIITPDSIDGFMNNLDVIPDLAGSSATSTAAELPFVKLVERASGPLGSGMNDFALHLGSAEEGLPFRAQGHTLEPVALQSVPLSTASAVNGAASTTDTLSFRMDHDLSHTIFTTDGKKGQLTSQGGAGLSGPMHAMISAIRTAKRPIILAGQGCNDAQAELLQFAEMMQIPVTTTLHALGCFDERHDLALNMVGMHGHPTPNFMVQECDLVINIGSRFDDRITGRIGDFIPEAKLAAEEKRGGVIHVDVRLSEKGKQVEPTFFVHTTGKQFLQEVNRALEGVVDGLDAERTKPWLARMKLLQSEYPVTIPHFATQMYQVQDEHGNTCPEPVAKTPMSAQSVISAMNALLLEADQMDQCIFSTGVGIHQMVAAQLITWTKPRQMLSSGSLGTMGVALGYAVGAKLANGGRIVIAIDGDGSFNMTFTELKTVAEQGIPVKILILDNESQMMVEYWQRLFHGGRYLAVRNQKNPEYTKLADAFGIKNLYVDCEEDLDAKMKEFLFADPDKPVLMHVRIERTPCLPLVAPGEALQNMILEDEYDVQMDASAAPS